MCSKLVFFNEKKIRKIQMIFMKKINFESQISALFDTFPLHQFAKSNDFIRLQLTFRQKPF